MQPKATSIPRYPDWLPRAIVSGFAATVVMTITLLLGYTVALVLASSTPNASASGQEMAAWFRGLTSNHLVDFTRNALYIALALHLTVGLVFAGIYGYFVQPRLSGPSWQRGTVFAVVPWILSLTVFFPLVGAGFLGSALSAGPLPILGNLIAHLAYGAILGVVYGPLGDILLTDSPTAEETLALVSTETMGARGVLVGVLVGIMVGMALELVSQGSAIGFPPLALVLAAALVGGAMGELVGSWMGLPAPSKSYRRADKVSG